MSTVYFRFPAHASAELERAPELERLLTRAQAVGPASDWREQAFRIVAPPAAPMPAVASAAWHQALKRPPGAWVFLATPLHLLAGMRSVQLPSDGILELDAAECEALARDFNRTFAGAGVHLQPTRSGALLCALDRPLNALTRAPEELLGQDIFEFMPAGPDAARVRSLMSEAEMWLHQHALNEARAARALPAISGLWLWGGGAAGAPLPPIEGWTAGADPLFAAYGAHGEYPGARAAGVIVVAHPPGTEGWREALERWLAPVAADLEAGRWRWLLLSAGARCYRIGARGAWRFWRRPRPWWESFAESVRG